MEISTDKTIEYVYILLYSFISTYFHLLRQYAGYELSQHDALHYSIKTLKCENCSNDFLGLVMNDEPLEFHNDPRAKYGEKGGESKYLLELFLSRKSLIKMT